MNVGLHARGRFAALHDTATGNDDDWDSRPSGLGGEGRSPKRVDRKDHRVGHLGQRGKVGMAGRTVDLVVAGVYEVHPGLPGHPRHVVANGPREIRPRGGADDRDRSRREQRTQVEAMGTRRSARRSRGRRVQPSTTHPTTRSTPRRSRARAMTSRWISLVPSHSRSTRSSRRYRSAG